MNATQVFSVLFLSLPIDKLSRLALTQGVQKIGQALASPV